MDQEAGLESEHLHRTLKLHDLVLFNIVAVLGLRWLATSARFGPGALVMWVAAALFFFVPQGLTVIELSSRFPGEGGIYYWTKQALGEGHGFLCGWCYWISNVLYYPNLLISTAVIATFIIGEGEGRLSENWIYVLCCALVALWLAVFLNIIGLGTGKWLQNLGGLGTYVPGLILIGLGVHAAVYRPPATPITAASLKPDWTDLPSLNLLATIAFAFAGLELSSTMGGEIENPHRNLPRAIYMAAPLIALVYILGTGSVLWLVPNQETNIVSGFLQAISNGAGSLSGSLFWLAPLAAACYTMGNLGGVGAWLTGPARVAFVVGLDRYFPPAFGRLHPRWRTPYVAILVQAVLSTVFLLLSLVGKGTTVERAYLVLLDMQVLVSFIPYLYLFISYLVLRRGFEPRGGFLAAPGGRPGAWAVGTSGMLVTLFAMVVATIPPAEMGSSWIFRVKVLGGAAAFVLAGLAIFHRGRRRRRGERGWDGPR